jgi:hypothetical protein
MTHALTGKPGLTVIGSRGVRHRITFAVDRISREPRLDHQTEAIDSGKGTKITVFLPVPTEGVVGLSNAAFDFGWVNPHLTLSFVAKDGVHSFEHGATEPGWTKWRPTDPTSAHWYDLASLKTLIAAEVNTANRSGLSQRTVADFVGEFRGLSGTAKRRDICEAASASRARLDGFYARGDAAVRRLLIEMQMASKPVKARDLGVIGEQHVLAVVGGGASARYKRTEVDVHGVPYLIEAGFCHRPGYARRTEVTGLNWSASIGGDPFGSVAEGDGLGSILAGLHAGPQEPIFFFLHVASPQLMFLDRASLRSICQRRSRTRSSPPSSM